MRIIFISLGYSLATICDNSIVVHNYIHYVSVYAILEASIIGHCQRSNIRLDELSDWAGGAMSRL